MNFGLSSASRARLEFPSTDDDEVDVESALDEVVDDESEKEVFVL